MKWRCECLARLAFLQRASTVAQTALYLAQCCGRQPACTSPCSWPSPVGLNHWFNRQENLMLKRGGGLGLPAWAPGGLFW